MKVDISAWDKRNVWTLSSGELAVRPGLFTLMAPGSGKRFVAGFSVNNSRTNSVWHYIIETALDTGLNATIRILDENFVTQQTVATGANTAVRSASLGVIEDQVMISSPDFPTFWGVVGSSLIRALKQPSLIEGREVLNVPQGILVSWAGRSVIAAPEALYISDALQPRTFDPINVLNPPGGAIYGLLVSPSGDLVVCTTTGVYSLAVDAAASGQLVLGIWQKVTDHATVTYDSVCASRGQLFGLTERGYKRIDQAVAPEVLVDEKLSVGKQSNTANSAVRFPDYRVGKLFGGRRGPILSIERDKGSSLPNDGYIHMADLERQIRSWWVSNGLFMRVTGILTEADGTELFVTDWGILRPQGNTDFGIGSGSGGSGSEDQDIVATMFGEVTTDPSYLPVVRSVDYKTDASQEMILSVNNQQQTFSPLRQVPPVTDTDVWGAATSPYRESAMAGKRGNFSERTANVAVQVDVTGALARLDSSLDIEFKGPGKQRRP